VLVPFIDRSGTGSRLGAVIRWAVGLVLAAGWILMVLRHRF
jgi:hypothetical protein